MRAVTAMFVTLGLVALVSGVGAQQVGFKRTVLQQSTLSVPGREAVTALAEFQPGATVGQHTHPGEEVGYILEGSIVLEQEGKPAVTLPLRFVDGVVFFGPIRVAQIPPLFCFSRVGKAERAHHSQRRWARRECAFAHPTSP